VFLSSTGVRSSITGNWLAPQPEQSLYQRLQVSAGGDRIVFSTAHPDAADKYRDTVVMDVPSRRILFRRTFSVRPNSRASAASESFWASTSAPCGGRLARVRPSW
jgi:hypothetical protein